MRITLRVGISHKQQICAGNAKEEKCLRIVGNIKNSFNVQIGIILQLCHHQVRKIE